MFFFLFNYPTLLYIVELDLFHFAFVLKRLTEILRATEGAIAEMFFPMCILTGTKTLWRKAGMTIRKEKTVLSLERHVFISSW